MVISIWSIQPLVLVAIHFFDGDAPIQFLAVRIEKCQHLPLSFGCLWWFYKFVFFPRNLVLASFWSSHFGNNMHHGLGNFLSLRLCLLGRTGNQLLLTDLFDEFYFVQISFGIPARATGLLFAFNFWLSESRSVIPSFCFFSRGLVFIGSILDSRNRNLTALRVSKIIPDTRPSKLYRRLWNI